jgi:diguanylate cyclase (GGDEF)-like protein
MEERLFLLVLICLVIGVVFLISSLIPSFKIIRQLPKGGGLQKQWYLLFCLIILFISGYIIDMIVVWNTVHSTVNLIVSGVFLGGSVFVLMVCLLTLHTIKDIQRISILEKENIIDPLTGIYNRRYLERRLNEEFGMSKRYNLPLSLLMMDVDHFKNINDTYGHQAGDIALKKLTAIINELTRETDFISRYGGDEIVIVLPNTSTSGASVFAKRCCNLVRERLSIKSSEYSDIEAPDFKDLTIDGLSVSIGVSSVNSINNNIELLMKSADQALYKAKEDGRNRFVVSESAL